MIEKLINKLIDHNYILDQYYSFFLKWQIEKKFYNQVKFENEGLDFNFSFFSIPWSKINENLKFFKADFSNANEFYEKFNIDPKKDEIVIEEFYSLDRLINLFDTSIIYDPRFNDGFMQIGFLNDPLNSRLMYSFEKENIGSIWLELPDECFLVKLGDNIIDLINRGQLSIQDANIKRFGSSLDQLYKNWGDDFWKVKD